MKSDENKAQTNEKKDETNETATEKQKIKIKNKHLMLCVLFFKYEYIK